MPDEPETPLRTEVAEGVATLTLNRPEALNALNSQLRRELLAALKAVARDEAVRSVVITGAGRGFCAGADLRGGSGERDFRAVLSAEYNPLIEAIRNLPKPVVAAVNGVAAGAGVSLAFAADVVVASEEARFVPAFSRIGARSRLGPRACRWSAGSAGIARSRSSWESASSARDDAHDLGLVAAVVPADRLADAARELAQRLAEGPTVSIGLTKRLLNAAEDATLADSLEAEAALQDLAGRSEDHAEGVAAFGEKRDPRFTGR